MKLLLKQLKIHVIDEYKEHEENITGGYSGMYSVVINDSIIVTFIPKFKRYTDKWYLNLPDSILEDDDYDPQEARIARAVNSRVSITPSREKAGTKEVFSLPIQFEHSALTNEKLDERIIYYVKPEDFYTFRGELATVSETASENNLVEISKLEDFEFIKFILVNVIGTKI